jgi:hypothetical protein
VTHPFRPCVFYGPAGLAGPPTFTDWCTWWPGASTDRKTEWRRMVAVGCDAYALCGRHITHPVHAGTTMVLPQPPAPPGYLGKWPPVCPRCGHRHAVPPCADHPWHDICPYDAGAECTTAGPRGRCGPHPTRGEWCNCPPPPPPPAGPVPLPWPSAYTCTCHPPVHVRGIGRCEWNTDYGSRPRPGAPPGPAASPPNLEEHTVTAEGHDRDGGDR